MKIQRINTVNNFQPAKRNNVKASGQKSKEINFTGIKENFLYFINQKIPVEKVPDKIVFEPSKTLSEAREFARKNLKIFNYELKNLDAANFINEGLSEFYNKSDDKDVVINEILSRDGGNVLMAMNYIFPQLVVNEAIFDYIDAFLKIRFGNSCAQISNFEDSSLFKIYEFTDKQKELFQKYENSPDCLSMKDKISILSISNRIMCKKPLSVIFLEALKNPSVFNYLEKNNKVKSLTGFKKLDENQRQELIQEIYLNTDFKQKINEVSPFYSLHHELGHKIHEKNIGCKKYVNLTYGMYANCTEKSKKNAIVRFCKTEPDWEYTGLVSKYAMTSPVEFVAEAYAELVSGNKLDDKVMQMYEKYGGVIPS